MADRLSLAFTFKDGTQKIISIDVADAANASFANWWIFDDAGNSLLPTVVSAIGYRESGVTQAADPDSGSP